MADQEAREEQSMEIIQELIDLERENDKEASRLEGRFARLFLGLTSHR